MMEFIETARTCLYYTVALCGVGYMTFCLFRLVDAIERPKKRNHRRARV